MLAGPHVHAVDRQQPHKPPPVHLVQDWPVIPVAFQTGNMTKEHLLQTCPLHNGLRCQI
ncbi:hypothetical protein DPMN_092715 [Dreissena polymorpha]|uniref:Uncharacterized protein n=1 Tax=Dreissena polymorpha TaxID=45954 RepID=A0A9D4R0B3_DREPO|nr:hypothetical protein DPMN_092715 [Dreissena polymorpha]